MRSLRPLIDSVLPEVVALRRDLHAHPELGYEEERTAAEVVRRLQGVPDLRIRTRVGGTGVVAVLGADLPGPAVALRADMDALPLQEETGLPHASTVPGKMHACGHDGHTAALVGAVRVLARVREELAGPVVFLFQPAEEGGAGAQRLCDEGVLDDPPVQAVFGLHNFPGPSLRLGQVGTRVGALMAAAGEFTVEVTGRGGHAAIPHATVDPVLVGSAIVQAAQAIVSRQMDPLSPVVLSVTCFHAGTARNVIPGTAELRGTYRALDDVTLADVRDRFAALAAAVAAAHGATATVETRDYYPALHNDRRAVAHLERVVKAVGRGDDWVGDHPPLLAAEDFAFYTRRVPGCFWFLGTRPEGAPPGPSLHHPRFDFNDDILPTAIELHVETARRFAWPARDGD